MDTNEKFELGTVYCTFGVDVAAKFDINFRAFCQECLQRHQAGDFGDLDEEDRKLNEEALRNGERIMSVYKRGKNTIWIITEHDRSRTTILFPSEY